MLLQVCSSGKEFLSGIMKKDHFIKRCMLLCFGLLVMAFGVAFSIKAGLGTSPISSLPYVASLLTPLTVGTATIVMHCALIFLQIAILRKNYNPYQLLQLPVAFLFGYLTDFSLWVIQSISPSSYTSQWLLCVLGIILVGIGVSCEVAAKVVVLAGEGLVLAVCQTFPLEFPSVKISFDCSLVMLAAVLSIVGLEYLTGIREGTIAAAVLVGIVAKHTNKLFMQKFIDHYFPQTVS